MTMRLSKRTILALFCYCRQAERSVDHALSWSSQGLSFVEYYDDKRDAIVSLIETLKAAGAVSDAKLDREFYSLSFFSALACLPVRSVLNKVRDTWAFSQYEVSFLCGTLEHLIRIVEAVKPQDLQELIDLRMDFCTCQEIIGWKLIGIPELKRAVKIEHFYRSDYLETVSLEEFVMSKKEAINLALEYLTNHEMRYDKFLNARYLPKEHPHNVELRDVWHVCFSVPPVPHASIEPDAFCIEIDCESKIAELKESL